MGLGTGQTSRGEAWPGLVLTDADELILGVKSARSLGCGDHALVKCVISWSMGLARRMVRTLKVRRGNFNLFKELVNEMPWETVLKDTGPDPSWQHSQAIFLRAQELTIMMCRKSCQAGKKIAWLSKDLLLKLRGKKKMHSQWRRDR